MCRNIRRLYNYEPPATEEEIHAAATQFVRKISGFNKPSAVNQEVFDQAVEGISGVVTNLFDTLITSAPPRKREKETIKAHIRQF